MDAIRLLVMGRTIEDSSGETRYRVIESDGVPRLRGGSGGACPKEATGKKTVASGAVLGSGERPVVALPDAASLDAGVGSAPAEGRPPAPVAPAVDGSEGRKIWKNRWVLGPWRRRDRELERQRRWVQRELMLESVTVVRNDLSESDARMLAGQPAGADAADESGESEGSAGRVKASLMAWLRRLFD